MDYQDGFHSRDRVKWVDNDITINLHKSLAFLSSLVPSSIFLNTFCKMRNETAFNLRGIAVK